MGIFINVVITTEGLSTRIHCIYQNLDKSIKGVLFFL